MQYFFETTDTIENGLGFSLFDSLHLAWIVFLLAAVVVNAICYKRFSDINRMRWRKIVAWLLIADELFKMAILFISGNYGVDYLPLHLCSINIFIIAVHAYKPSTILDNFLYTVCSIPL